MKRGCWLLAVAALLLTGCGTTVQVRDPHGQPVAGARVILHHDGVVSGSAKTNSEGEARFRRLDGSSDWTLEIVAPGFSRMMVDRPQGEYLPVTMEFGDEYQRWGARADGRTEPPADNRR